MPTTLPSRSPIDDAVLGEVPVRSAAEVDQAVARARQGFTVWGALDHAARRAHLHRFRRALAARSDELVDLIHRENGKPRSDALGETLLALSLLDFAASRAGKVLSPVRRSAFPLLNYRARVAYRPYGVVAVIGPWNYPLSTPMGSIAAALAAGNTVVFKPSELTPLIAELVASVAADSIAVADVLQVVTGDSTTGAALARAAVDKLSFTGSTATGRKVMAAAADRLTPVVMELGGNDPMIVTRDADLDEAAGAAVFGALSNAGQACISVERVLVEDAVHDRFVELVCKQVGELRWGRAAASPHIGPITRPEQLDVIRAHLADAVDKGARVVAGGADDIDGAYVPPTVLVDVAAGMRLVDEETFGPVLPVVRVADGADALRRANATRFGLGSAVFAGRRGRALADRLHTGMTAVDSVLAFAAMPALPFGGVGESGFGRIHGDEGLREFARAHAIVERRFASRFDGLRFQLKDGVPGLYRRMIRLLHGGGLVDRVVAWLRNPLG